MSVYQNFKKITDSELEQEEYRFNSEISNTQIADQAWEELASFFDQNPDVKLDHLVSYWRWFVILSWQKISTASPEMVLLMMKEQVPMAIVANMDILDVILRHLTQNFYYRDDLGSFYKKARAEFLESDMVFGKWQGQDQIIKDIVAEHLLLKKQEADSIEVAEFISKIRQILFPKEVLPYAYVDVDTGVGRFIELINFFQDVDDEKKIQEVLDIFLIPGRYQSSPVEENTEIKAVASLEMEKPNAPQIEVEVKKPLNTNQIKSQIESEFKKDGEGNFEDIEGVMGRLSELAEENNDSSIAEMIYFDEEENKFKWKE